MDNSMYTGTNSGSFGNVLEQASVKRAKETKQVAKSKLLPAYDLVIEHIDREIDRVRDLDSLFIDEAISPAELHRDLLGRKAYVEYLRSLKQIMSNIVREK
ncbi:MAG: hypothetical protein JWN75_1117 [Candidatus Saccharibacteria bacterium]|nr:hypothetical protein [Candidatus Saccharibacteria bacterium]